MGVIYSSGELMLGEIPSAGAHLKAAQAVMEQIAALDCTVITMVHGSVVNGTANTRSDLDVLVTYDSTELADEPRHIRAINNLLDNIGDETYVKIEPNIWPAHEAIIARRERMYDLIFSRHLSRSMREPFWAAGPVDETIVEIAESSYGSDEMLRKVVLNYTTYKHNGFSKAPSQFSESDKALAALQRAFELPKSTGRKIGQMLGFDKEATPEENWQMLVESGLSGEARDAMTGLYELDNECTRRIEDLTQTPGKVDTAGALAYKRWLGRVFPSAMDLGIVAASGFTNYIAAA